MVVTGKRRGRPRKGIVPDGVFQLQIQVPLHLYQFANFESFEPLNYNMNKIATCSNNIESLKAVCNRVEIIKSSNRYNKLAIIIPNCLIGPTKLKFEGKGLDQSRTLNLHSTNTHQKLVYQFQDIHAVESQYIILVLVLV